MSAKINTFTLDKEVEVETNENHHVGSMVRLVSMIRTVKAAWHMGVLPTIHHY